MLFVYIVCARAIHLSRIARQPTGALFDRPDAYNKSRLYEDGVGGSFLCVFSVHLH
jgi:hypothetical protein